MNDIISDFINTKSNEQSGDYYKDGLLYCGKCNTPKQWKGTIMGRQVETFCLCKCQEEARDKRRADEKAIQRAAYIEGKRDLVFAGQEQMKKWTFDADDEANSKLSRRARKYVENFNAFAESGRGIMLYGNTGTGKTFIACCIVNALIDKGICVKVTTVSKIANDLFSQQDKSEYMKELTSCGLLMIDDLGTERNTGYMNETLYNVIDGRYRNDKPTIVTTNMTAKQIKEATSVEQQRIFSRLKEICFPLEVAGEDRRIQNAKQRYAEDLKLLDD